MKTHPTNTSKASWKNATSGGGVPSDGYRSATGWPLESRCGAHQGQALSQDVQDQGRSPALRSILQGQGGRNPRLVAQAEGPSHARCSGQAPAKSPGRQARPAQLRPGSSHQVRGGASPKTLNNELGYLRAVYNELRGLGVIDYANPHVEIIALICLATGARWSEAEKLKPTGLRNGVITFSGTKNGKVRSVLITIVRHWKQNGQTNSAITSFRRALARTTIRLPKGQADHSLRHTFASHFMQKGGNILTLQKILDHSSLAMTMRYAHLAPEHLAEAVRLNPLADVFSRV